MPHQACSGAGRHEHPHHLTVARAPQARLQSEYLYLSAGRCFLPSDLIARLDLGVHPYDIHVSADCQAGSGPVVRSDRRGKETAPPDWDPPERSLLAI